MSARHPGAANGTEPPSDLALGIVPRDILLDKMEDIAALLLDIDDPHSVDRSPVGRLAARFRVKSRALEDKRRPTVAPLAADDPDLEIRKIGVVKIEPGGHGSLLIISIIS